MHKHTPTHNTYTQRKETESRCRWRCKNASLKKMTVGMFARCSHTPDNTLFHFSHTHYLGPLKRSATDTIGGHLHRRRLTQSNWTSFVGALGNANKVITSILSLTPLHTLTHSHSSSGDADQSAFRARCRGRQEVSKFRRGRLVCAVFQRKLHHERPYFVEATQRNDKSWRFTRRPKQRCS